MSSSRRGVDCSGSVLTWDTFGHFFVVGSHLWNFTSSSRDDPTAADSSSSSLLMLRLYYMKSGACNSYIANGVHLRSKIMPILLLKPPILDNKLGHSASKKGHMLELHSPRGHIGARGPALVNSILPEEKSLLQN